MTDAERRLWSRLRHRQVLGVKFRRQVPIDRFIVDFATFDRRLVVEVDGGQHADNRSDDARDLRLRSLGWRVLRVWNSDVLTNTDGVVQVIMGALEQR